MTKILIDEVCKTKEQGDHSLEPTTNVVEEKAKQENDTLDMDEREPIDGWSSLYIGDIEIILEETVASKSSLEHEDEELVETDFFLGSTFQ